MSARSATLLARLNRFVARVRLSDGTEVPVHVASSGRMTELLIPGAEAIITYNPQPGRATAGLLQLVRTGETWVSVDTSVPGKLLRRAFQERTLEPFSGYTGVRPEYTYGDSRLDFLLTADGLPPCLVEVKSVTSAIRDHDGVPVARFPDAPTARGAKHLRELAHAVAEGYRAAVCFVVQRGDAQAFGPWDAIDPEFGATLREVRRRGVEIYAFATKITPEAMRLAGLLPLRLGP